MITSRLPAPSFRWPPPTANLPAGHRTVALPVALVAVTTVLCAPELVPWNPWKPWLP